MSRLNPLHWSIYIQQCYEDILKAPENDNDIYLAYLLELHRIAENVKNIGIQSLPSETLAWNDSMGTYLKLFMAELRKFKVSLPESLQHDRKSNVTPFNALTNSADFLVS